MRHALLTQAVESVPDLCRVRIMENLMHGSTGTISTYQHYFELLMDAAFHYDQNIKNGSKRSNVHWTQTSDFIMAPHEEVTFDTIDETDQYQIHATRGTKKAAPKKTIWDSSSSNIIRLPPELWSQIPQEVQANIITHNRNQRNTSTTKTLQANKHLQVTQVDDDTPIHETEPHEYVPNTYLLFTMVHNSVSESDTLASDITQVLSINQATYTI
jgi:hypothetical protein